ncbi:hypothetical protein PV10_04024 [Exophiala mesophila]|uniref:Uncharacterized protein n=1 Tax=Exophiala mesophila TaxID=212818 RepID=A0A0D1WU36_EXOME|nr:uncharacterized protein PV10_04024 [Exophiala mesophila]KIV92755.1 hypothetical protein PV10_04024 [Exophiala mesophila]
MWPLAFTCPSRLGHSPPQPPPLHGLIHFPIIAFERNHAPCHLLPTDKIPILPPVHFKPRSSPLTSHFLGTHSCLLDCVTQSPMPGYYLHDCHYFFRTALRLLSIATLVAALYA